MIVIDKQISSNNDNGFIQNIYSAKINLKDIKSEVEVHEYNNDKIFRIYFEEGKINLKTINKLIDCSFSNFIEGKQHNNFEASYPKNVTYGKSGLFDGFNPMLTISKKEDKAFISMSLINPWEFKEKEWEKYSPWYIEKLLKTEIDKGQFSNFLAEYAPEKGDNLKDFKLHDLITGEGLIVAREFDCEKKISEAIKVFFLEIEKIQIYLIEQLDKIEWLKVFEKNEAVFSKKLLLPLLQKLGYHNVRYTHGILEFGKDFIFSEYTRFNEEIHFGMQVKAGDLKGNVKSEIEEIISQVKDAFDMPFHKLGDKSEFYISIFIVVISGKFTQNAKMKIRQKLNRGYTGKVFFWDKEKIIELMNK